MNNENAKVSYLFSYSSKAKGQNSKQTKNEINQKHQIN